MTRARVFGSDSAFGAWLRSQQDISSRSTAFITANDVDFMIHKYRSNEDSMGERHVHLMMDMEVKTRGAMPSASQLQTLYFRHQLLSSKKRKLANSKAKHKKATVWNYGVFILSLAGDSPDDSSRIEWCKFGPLGCVLRQQINVSQLKDILRFDIDPSTLKKLELRRHHLTQKLLQVEQLELPGLGSVERIITKRS